MESQNCTKCGKSVSEEENFCPECGNGLKCNSCGTRYKKDSKFCTKCGVQIHANHVATNSALNTIKYRKSNDEISCEIAFTDQIGKEGMNDLLAAIVNNRGGLQNHQTNDFTSQNDNPLEISASKSVDPNSDPTNDGSVDSANIHFEIPHLNDVENKIDCSENIWIAIHAFYVSEHGDKNFNRDEVREAYMKRRKTDSRVSNFAAEWKKAHQKYFRTINDKELNFQTGSIDELKNLLSGNTAKNPPKNKKPSNATASRKTSAKSITVEEFDLSANTSANKPSLEDFLTEKKPGDSTADRIVVIAYYITRINKEEDFTEGQIEYAYKALQLPERPSHLRQTINNIKNGKVWFKDVSGGKWSLERIGEIYVDQKLPPKDLNI
ncbi:zinc ribbon domain-containing protein [Pedobacter aquatilis]|uniref:zinc ribbon domain-containing protein n=1 Tax=Pedobacter aquatilis TaxID=351343 RepID=UPI00292FB27A|nr:zinc ribbon domain-containing protein [Pedobacter aquatilis]